VALDLELGIPYAPIMHNSSAVVIWVGVTVRRWLPHKHRGLHQSHWEDAVGQKWKRQFKVLLDQSCRRIRRASLLTDQRSHHDFAPMNQIRTGPLSQSKDMPLSRMRLYAMIPKRHEAIGNRLEAIRNDESHIIHSDFWHTTAKDCREADL
jgi:hypothetical protein